MTALPFENNFKRVCVCHGVPREECDLTKVYRCISMQRIEFLNPELFDQSVLYHVSAPGKAFFSRLKYSDQSAGKIPVT